MFEENKVTIPVKEYKELIEAKTRYDMFKDTIYKHCIKNLVDQVWNILKEIDWEEIEKLNKMEAENGKER